METAQMTSNVTEAKGPGGALVTWTAIGTAAQLAMIVAGHFSEAIRNNVFAVGGMLISLIVGGLYAKAAAGSKGAAAGGGAVVGGLCALIGIIVSVILGDTEPMILAIGTISSAVTGLIGGIVFYLVAGGSSERASA